MDIKSKGRVFGLAIIGAVFIATNASPGAGPAIASGGHDLRSSLDVGANSEQAKADARTHLSLFLDRVLDQKRPTRGVAAIKVAFPSEAGRAEPIWVEPVSQRGNIVVAVIANDGTTSAQQTSRQTLTLSTDQIVDWSFAAPNGRMYGNYTARTALRSLSPEHAARISSALSTDPLPSNW